MQCRERNKVKNWTKITSKKGLIFWRDNHTGLLWSPQLKDKYTFDQALEISQASFVVELGKFKNRTWGIPARDEIAASIANGLLAVIPELKSFWSLSVLFGVRELAWISDGRLGYVYGDLRGHGDVVRCVGRTA
jgi:hypothetical protein